MYHYFFKVLFLMLAVFSMTVNAGTIDKQDVPEKVFSYIYKKHPKAQDITVEKTTHFGLPLFKVCFKANQYNLNNRIYQAEFVRLFRFNGHFYTNEIAVERHAFNVISDAAKKGLQLNYPDYEILAMKAVSNPNGVGEEYEIDLLVSEKILNISIDDKGKVISETKQE
jgi:hypothetical protein